MTDSRHPLPLLVYAVTIAIRLTNASCGPAAYLVNHMSEGHSTALRRSLSECLKEWMTHPSGTLGRSHLLMAAEAELALVVVVLLYRGKA